MSQPQQFHHSASGIGQSGLKPVLLSFTDSQQQDYWAVCLFSNDELSTLKEAYEQQRSLPENTKAERHIAEINMIIQGLLAAIGEDRLVTSGLGTAPSEDIYSDIRAKYGEILNMRDAQFAREPGSAPEAGL